MSVDDSGWQSEAWKVQDGKVTAGGRKLRGGNIRAAAPPQKPRKTTIKGYEAGRKRFDLVLHYIGISANNLSQTLFFGCPGTTLSQRPLGTPSANALWGERC